MSKHAYITQSKILERDVAARRVNGWRVKGEKIVFTNGCFDLVHLGHISYLEEARSLGDRLVIGLNTDRSVQQLKGPRRPVLNENDRARLLAALECTDLIVLFEEETPYELIKALVPDILIKGGDYEPDTIVGADVVRENGGEVRVLPFVSGYSTTSLIKRIQELK